MCSWYCTSVGGVVVSAIESAGGSPVTAAVIATSGRSLGVGVEDRAVGSEVFPDAIELVLGPSAAESQLRPRSLNSARELP